MLTVLTVIAADPRHPHPHQGFLAKYERKAPSEYGLTNALRGVSRERLQQKAVCRMLLLPSGYKRCTAIREVEAPADLVFARIIDLPAYPRMINGITRCDVYQRGFVSPRVRSVCAHYRVRELGVTLEAFMAHEFEVGRRCLTFSLDYSRRSDITDTVGYWYVERVDQNWSRLYYSIDSSMPAWLPPPLRDALLNVAAKRATGWVDAEVRRVMASRQRSSLAASSSRLLSQMRELPPPFSLSRSQILESGN